MQNLKNLKELPDQPHDMALKFDLLRANLSRLETRDTNVSDWKDDLQEIIHAEMRAMLAGLLEGLKRQLSPAPQFESSNQNHVTATPSSPATFSTIGSSFHYRCTSASFGKASGSLELTPIHPAFRHFIIGSRLEELSDLELEAIDDHLAPSYPNEPCLKYSNASP